MMRNILENYTPKNNFWQFNPQFLSIEPFKSFYKDDKSKGKKKSSDIMWAIALVNHPESDIYYISDKYERVAEDMLGEDISVWGKYSKLVEEFLDAALTQAQKSMHSWNQAMIDRDKFLSKQRYHFEEEVEDEEGNIRIIKSNVKELDEMRGRTAKLYQDYLKIKKELEEDAITRGKGQKIKSLSDEGSI